MPHHVIIDGSNLATEGRTAPSLKQLNEAVDAYRCDHPEALITVVVDATFGHRIDPKEVHEFERAIETNAFVAPPAGAIGRGDGFILSIAQKVKATVLSNDSYQEFHGEYAWLFDDGRLVGGKPVPHVGWVFVYRTPVRGPISRRSVKEQKVVEKSPGRRRGSKPSSDLAALPTLSANAPMPVPRSAPPGSVMPAEKPTAAKSVNDLMVFLSFVEHHPVDTTVEAVIDSYSSHGAYVRIGEAHGYLPLRLMGNPAPRSAREAVSIGETVTLVVHSFGPARRSIDLAVLAMSPDAKPALPARPRRGDAKKASALSAHEAKSSTKKTVDKKLVEKNPADKKVVEKKPVVKKLVEKKPVVSKPVEKRPVEKRPVEKKPVEKKPVEKRPPEKLAVGKATSAPKVPNQKVSAGAAGGAKKTQEKKAAALKSAVPTAVTTASSVRTKLPSHTDSARAKKSKGVDKTGAVTGANPRSGSRKSGRS